MGALFKPGYVCAQRLIEEDKSFVQPAARRNEVLGWVSEGLRDFSISRAAVSWGIPIPRDPAQTVYVWFDALLGYMSGALPIYVVTAISAACRAQSVLWRAHGCLSMLICAFMLFVSCKLALPPFFPFVWGICMRYTLREQGASVQLDQQLPTIQCAVLQKPG